MIKSLTVCVCTHNRANLLPMVLDRLDKESVLESFHFNVIIVDNASTDSTYEVASKYTAANSQRFSYIYEKNIGLSNARNRGLQESTADVVAFVDDDAVPRDGWLEALIEGYGQGEDVGVVGGQALLVLPDTPLPIWFKKPLYSYFSEKEIEGYVIFECNEITDYPFGTNISFHRELALKFGGFRSDLGRKGKELLSGEETHLCYKFRRAGYRILINPKSIVDHYITMDRINLKYLFRQAWRDGQSHLTRNAEAPDKKLRVTRLLRDAFKWAMVLASRPPTPAMVVLNIYRIIADFSRFYHRWKSGRRFEINVI